MLRKGRNLGRRIMAKPRKRYRYLQHEYSFPSFRASNVVRGVFGDPNLRIVYLNRRSKKPCADAVDMCSTAGTIGGAAAFATSPAVAFGSNWSSTCGVCIAGSVRL